MDAIRRWKTLAHDERGLWLTWVALAWPLLTLLTVAAVGDVVSVGALLSAFALLAVSGAVLSLVAVRKCPRESRVLSIVALAVNMPALAICLVFVMPWLLR
jgi:hypothetical protein